MHNCENERNIIDIAKDLKVNDDSHKKLMSYYIFETVTTYSFSKNGEKVSTIEQVKYTRENQF